MEQQHRLIIMSRYDQILKNLKEAISNPHLYNEEEIRFMKTQLRELTESKQQFLREDNNGFGS